MFAACYGACEFSADCECGHCGLIYLVVFTIAPLLPGYVYTGPNPDSSDNCQCSMIGYSLIGACAVCQGHDPVVCDHIVFLSQFPGANESILSIAGLNMRTSADLLYLLRSEFLWR